MTAAGDPEPLGVTPRDGGVNVAVFSANADAIEFCLFDGAREVRRARLRGRTGDVHHDHIPNVAPGDRYGLRAHGPWLPCSGHFFNPAKLLLDPYARVIDRPFALHRTMFGYRSETRPGDMRPDGLVRDDSDSAPVMPKAIVQAACSPTAGAARITDWPRTVLYELHVRGFTARHPGIPEAIRGRFAGLAHPAAIEHLTRVGITTVEIMPPAAWIEERHLAALGLRNYWGYNTVAFMAPDPILAPDGWAEVRSTVAALAAAGIEVILDVVLNHTGEGDVLGPTLSLRGLDNATYYRSRPGPQWRYADDTGCGNTVALDRPAPLRLMMDTLRLWAGLAGVHGFRFDLATTMGRRDDGFDPAAPLLSAIEQDPLLRDLKLIAEPWDVGAGGYRIGSFPAPWGEWNDRFRDDVRRFWRGDPGLLGSLATRLAGSSDLFASRRVASRSVNFVVAHDGFTLADLVSYTHKENAANGEENRDGTDANQSWNNGVEGPTRDPDIVAARRRDQRALLASLLLARGTPMLAMGAELGHSQNGNNNAYAQDNPSAWLDWTKPDEGLLAWTRHLLRIRRDYAVPRDDRFLTGTPFDASLFPDVAWTDAAGLPISPDAWQASGGDTLAMTLAGPAGNGDGTDRLSVILHRGAVSLHVVLPRPRAGYVWREIANSADDPDPLADRDPDPGPPINELSVRVRPRSVQVLIEQPIARRERTAADPALLERLAGAAGIAPEWWDVDGKRTVVSDDTRRALLAAMRLPATTEGEARDTLRQLSDELDRRALPQALIIRGDQPGRLSLGLEPGLSRREVWLMLDREDGQSDRIRLRADDGNILDITGADGLPARVWSVPLPSLPTGRHRLWREDAPDAPCHLTVAPAQCYLPDTIRQGARRFGISAQLYAQYRANDVGIGDFTTLALLAEAAAREGAATVGINPLHMLFPGDRERASPYHPSDRRYLDPIYLDVPTMPPAAIAPELIAYSDVWERKRAALETDFAAFIAADGGAMRDAFDRFVTDSGTALARFAVFQAIAETRPKESWRQWPEALRSPENPGVEAFARANADRVLFHQYLQFLADRQFAAAAARGRESGLDVGLFRDLAVGAAPDGAEAWATADDLAQGAWVGAPPDPFAAQGQNWHLPPPLPLRLPRDGYAGFAALIAANMRHAGALRIDHVMGLSRLFWIPDGGTGADGAYVRYPLTDLLGQLALESARGRCMVIGEDLGTVPEGFREVLSKADIFSYRVLLLEREGARFRPASSYPARAVACVATHDLPPFIGWWEGADVRERSSLGDLASLPDAERERQVERRELTATLADAGCLTDPDRAELSVEALLAGAYRFIASTPSELVLVQMEDLAGMRVGVNLPGTDTERPNWRRRLPAPVDAVLTGSTARTVLDAVRSAGRGVAAPPNTAPILPD